MKKKEAGQGFAEGIIGYSKAGTITRIVLYLFSPPRFFAATLTYTLIQKIGQARDTQSSCPEDKGHISEPGSNITSIKQELITYTKV